MINVQDLNLSDSVVMGNVEQKITHISDTSPLSCPECGVVSGVIRVIPCSDEYCDNWFCDLCHPDCRYIDFTPSTDGRDFDGYITLGRFDSGEGVGAICELCINEIMEDAESEHIIWWQGEKISNARLFAIKITVLWGIIGYLDYTVIPSIDIFSRILAIPFFVSWMLYLLNNKRYNRIVRDLEEISI